jgi:hypothetical protein
MEEEEEDEEEDEAADKSVILQRQYLSPSKWPF